MTFLKVCLCILLSFSLQAEIPFQQMKGFHAQMKPEAEIFSPIYGFLALNTGTLERIRFFGNYGKIYKTRHEKKTIRGEEKELIMAPTDFVTKDLGYAKEFMHPAFGIKDVEKLSMMKLQKTDPKYKQEGENYTFSMDELNQENERNFGRQFEYPLDEISALIQWLFPIVDGANFVANDRSKDPVGEITLNVDHLSPDDKGHDNIFVRTERELKEFERKKEDIL